MKSLLRRLLGHDKPEQVDGKARSIERQQDHLERELRELQTQAALLRLRKRREERA